MRFLAHHLSDNNHFRRSGSHGSTALCVSPCVASRGAFQARLHPPPKYKGVPFMIRALFCNVQIDIVKPNADIRHPTCRQAMIAPVLQWRVEGARSHAAQRRPHTGVEDIGQQKDSL